MDKSFKQYLIESTKTYSFKLKIAGELEEDIEQQIKDALHKFSVVSISTGKRTPIQEKTLDFPDLQNVRITMWDIEIKYPTTTDILQNYISTTINYPSHCVKVCNLNDSLTQYQENKDKKTEEILNNPNMEDADPAVHEMVGNKRFTGLLHSIMSCKRTTGEVYKDVNAQILATSIPAEQLSGPIIDSGSSTSVIGSTKINKPEPK